MPHFDSLGLEFLGHGVDGGDSLLRFSLGELTHVKSIFCLPDWFLVEGACRIVTPNRDLIERLATLDRLLIILNKIIDYVLLRLLFFAFWSLFSHIFLRRRRLIILRKLRKIEFAAPTDRYLIVVRQTRLRSFLIQKSTLCHWLWFFLV